MNIDWIKSFDGAITVCDDQGVILEMNDRAIANFAKDGGAALIGRNVLDCHPEPARAKLAGLMRERRSNVYTTEKAGLHRLIYQIPWTAPDGRCGFMELIIDLPADMAHHLRD